MAVNKVVMNTANGEETLIDLTGDTVVASDLAEGVTAHGADGERIVGTMPTDVVRYGTTQSLTAAQTENARRNIGIDLLSLSKVKNSVIWNRGLERYEVGAVVSHNEKLYIRLNNWGDDYNPEPGTDESSWKELDVEDVFVTIYPAGDEYAADKTFAELLEAYQQGKMLFAKVPAMAFVAPVSMVMEEGMVFLSYAFGDEPALSAIIILANDEITVESLPLATPDSIPTELPNPHALTIKGQSYDGSSPVTIAVADGQRGTGILKITTAPSSYTTATGGFTPKYRIALSTVTSQSKVNEVLVGDVIQYSYYQYPVGYVDSSYVYCGTRTSIRGATGTTPVRGTDYWTEDDKTEIKDYVYDALPINYKTPQECGTVGSGNDTSAFQTALANNRHVFVPGGTYTINGELVVRDACHLELAQDAVLNFTNTSGNCITLNRSAFLKGNHATVNVPYSFSGRVINVDTSVHTSVKDVPPFIHWCPQWKTARYITDLNICKADGDGLHQSTSGDSNGTAVYICANGSATSTFIWGLNFSGIRIAGSFEYGIRALNLNGAYNHEMRIEAFMDACKIGVSLEDCNNAYISATVQPRKAGNGSVYAVHGIQLIRSENADLSGSRVWDWNAANSKWTYDKTNINQHIAMYGNCQGTILNDYLYYHLPTGFNDIRELIYTEAAYKDVNHGSLIILQEPITKWFRPVDNAPYFNNGDGNKRLVLKEEQDALFQTDYVAAFDNKLPKATDGNGAVFNEIGYLPGATWQATTTAYVANDWVTCTGFIPCKQGDTLYLDGMTFATGSDDCRIVLYDSSFNRLMHVNRANLIAGNNYYVTYTATDNGCKLKINYPAGVAYATLSVYTSAMSLTPAVAVNEQIAYTQEGFLADGIKVKESSLTGMEKYERTGRMVTSITASSTDAQYPTAKAVYALVSGAMGEYVNAVDALIGGGS